MSTQETATTTMNCTYKFIRAGYHEIYNVCSGSITRVEWGLSDYASALFFFVIGLTFVWIAYVMYTLLRKVP